MLKALAVIRTVFLVFIVGYTIYCMPTFLTMPRTLDEQYARCSASQAAVTRAAWLAIAWIALETGLGWILARRRPFSTSSPVSASR